MPDETNPAPDGGPGAPSPASVPAAKPAAPAAATTFVKLAFPHDEFHPGIEGVPVITRQPTEIPTASLEDVQKAAKKSRVTVTTTEEN